MPVAGLVLHLRDEDRLAAQRRRVGEPGALRLHADDLGVRVLGDLPDERAAVALRHPVARLDPVLLRDHLLEVSLQLRLGTDLSNHVPSFPVADHAHLARR